MVCSSFVCFCLFLLLLLLMFVLSFHFRFYLSRFSGEFVVIIQAALWAVVVLCWVSSIFV